MSSTTLDQPADPPVASAVPDARAESSPADAKTGSAKAGSVKADGAAPASPVRALARRLRRISGLLTIVVLWQIAASRGWLGTTTPPPTEVWHTGYGLVRSGELQQNLLVSLDRVAKGLAIGLPVGFLLGLAAGLVKIADDVIDAPLQAMRMLPHLALVPLFIIWFGIGEASKVALIAIGPIFPLYINVYHGIRGVDERLVESARSCGVGGIRLLFTVILPGALPHILVGLRQSLGIAWLSLVVAEQIAASSGIGFLSIDAAQFMKTDVVFVVLVIYALLGLATDLFVRFLERRAFAWRRGLVAR